MCNVSDPNPSYLNLKMQRKPVLALTASDGPRKEELTDLVAQHWGLITKLFCLIATAGTYDSLKEKLGDRSLEGKIERLDPGDRGGLIEIAYHVVMGSCRALLFFPDPQDMKLLRPENRSLRRVCTYKGVAMFQRSGAFLDFIIRIRDLPGGERKKRYPGRVDAMAESLIKHPEWIQPHRNKTIALVAHDNKKVDMCAFAIKYKPQLERAGRILATGTTGGIIEKYAELPVIKYESGPHGGDVQIAHEILHKRCDALIFFIDPLYVHPHIEDIHMLVEACNLKKTKCQVSTSYDEAKHLLADLLPA